YYIALQEKLVFYVFISLGYFFFFFFQAEDGIRDGHVTGVQTCALPISPGASGSPRSSCVRGTMRTIRASSTSTGPRTLRSGGSASSPKRGPRKIRRPGWRCSPAARVMSDFPGCERGPRKIRCLALLRGSG